jgi:hypothetical protein
MLYPITCVDNFFDNPNDIKNYAETLNYSHCLEGNWPGERSNYLHEINPAFFNWCSEKILSIYFPQIHEYLEWSAKMQFQRINGSEYNHEGWIHKDNIDSEFTAIIYLSEESKCGTSIYKPKLDNFINYAKEKKEGYLNKKTNLKCLKENNSKFEKTINFDSSYNRIILFDGGYLHGADNFGKEERLTLITFFSNIKITKPEICLKYPVSEMKRI